jgi:hypothetical protein
MGIFFACFIICHTRNISFQFQDVANQGWVPRINVESLVKADPMPVPGEVNFEVRLNGCTYCRGFIYVYGSLKFLEWKIRGSQSK